MNRFIKHNEKWINILKKIFGIPKHDKPKGNNGEKKVGKTLRTLNDKEYRVLNDITIRHKDGNTSQIDHIVVSLYGIFVIETKDYKGTIYGKADDYKWVQFFTKWSKFPFLNPLIQNQGHITALRHLFRGYNTLEFESIVVFAGSANIRKISKIKEVMRPGGLIKYIYKFKRKVLTAAVMNEVIEILIDANECDIDTRNEHISHVNHVISGEKSENNADSKMIRRTLSSNEREELALELKKMRRKIADEEDIMAYLIFSNESLEKMINYRIMDKKFLVSEIGIKNKIIEVYGDEIIEILSKY